VRACVRTSVCLSLRACVHACVRARVISACVCVHVFAHVYVCVRMCACGVCVLPSVRACVRACVRASLVRAWLFGHAREVRPLGGSTGLCRGLRYQYAAVQVTLNVMTTYIALLESNKAVRPPARPSGPQPPGEYLEYHHVSRTYICAAVAHFPRLRRRRRPAAAGTPCIAHVVYAVASARMKATAVVPHWAHTVR
jgi:hypothetical protein